MFAACRDGAVLGAKCDHPAVAGEVWSFPGRPGICDERALRRGPPARHAHCPSLRGIAMPELSPQTGDKLKKVATPTLMTALYRRGLRNQWIQDVHLINTAAAPMVGVAFNLRYMAAREEPKKLQG